MELTMLTITNLKQSFDYPINEFVLVVCSKCNKHYQIKISALRIYCVKNKTIICRGCAAKEIGLKLRKDKTVYSKDNFICNICKNIKHIQIKSAKDNMRYNNGIYICKSCAMSKAHKDGKFADIYTDKFKSKLKDNGDRFWEINRDTWREKLVTPEFKQKMSECGKRAWTDEYRKRMVKVRFLQPKTSSQQKILYSLLDDLKIKYYDDQDIKCIIGYFCFDCRIDPQEGIKLEKSLLIEVQGDYWHNLPKNIRNDKSKATYLKTYFPEYDLKYLWEHEFDNKDRVINLLKYWLGLSKFELINFDFKDIQERIADYKTAELFISKYHYAGRVGRSGINLGYYLGDELVAVIIYVNPTRQETAIKQGYAYDNVLELSRLAIHPQYQVKNLASYLIGRSINYIKQNKLWIKLLISFADTTYNHLGTIYKASNWILDGEVAPDYWYADNKGYVCHKKTLWYKASKNVMSESEYCSKFNYSKVWGDKKFRYIYKLV